MTESGSPERGATRLIFLVCGMAQSSWAPLVPYAKARILANDQDLGLLLLCLGARSMLSMPAMGTIVGRYGCKRLIQCSAASILLGLPAVSVARSSTALALSLFLFGASVGALDVVMNVQASLVERHSGENLMSGFHALCSVGGFTGASIMSGLLSLDVTPWAAALTIVFLLATVLLLANSALLPYGDGRKERTKMSVWPGSHILLLPAMAFVMMLAEGSMLDWSAVFLVDKTGMINKNPGIGYTIFSIAMTMSRLGGNSIIQRLGRKWTI
jgi:predicted MFS family arabinose efflux permease